MKGWGEQGQYFYTFGSSNRLLTILFPWNSIKFSLSLYLAIPKHDIHCESALLTVLTNESLNIYWHRLESVFITILTHNREISLGEQVENVVCVTVCTRQIVARQPFLKEILCITLFDLPLALCFVVQFKVYFSLIRLLSCYFKSSHGGEDEIVNYPDY